MKAICDTTCWSCVNMIYCIDDDGMNDSADDDGRFLWKRGYIYLFKARNIYNFQIKPPVQN
jgi:hypothetical protein